MPKLRNPETGTVVGCEGSLAARYLSRGWVDVDASAKPAKAAPEKPKQHEPDAGEDEPVKRSQTRRTSK